jgi:hypothetical protein
MQNVNRLMGFKPPTSRICMNCAFSCMNMRFLANEREIKVLLQAKTKVKVSLKVGF